MDQDSNFIENEFADITAYENYITMIRDPETKRRHQGQLEMFINPEYQWKVSAQKRKLLSDGISLLTWIFFWLIGITLILLGYLLSLERLFYA